MTKELLPYFEGRENVTCYTSDTGTKIYLTQAKPFREEAVRRGGCKLNTLENDTKHILFLFDSQDREVGRFYMGKKLQGKSPKEITELLDIIAVFDSYNIKTKQWVQCVGYYKKAEETMDWLSKIGENAFNKRMQEYIEAKQEREREEQEMSNIREYGTTDPKRIEKLIEKRKQENKENRSFWIFIVIVGFLLYILMGGIARCAGAKGDFLLDNDIEWQYKHTDRHY